MALKRPDCKTRERRGLEQDYENPRSGGSQRRIHDRLAAGDEEVEVEAGSTRTQKRQE
jgi:hypothetical protein